MIAPEKRFAFFSDHVVSCQTITKPRLQSRGFSMRRGKTNQRCAVQSDMRCRIPRDAVADGTDGRAAGAADVVRPVLPSAGVLAVGDLASGAVAAGAAAAGAAAVGDLAVGVLAVAGGAAPGFGGMALASG